MRELITSLLPHAPGMGLYVHPDIPEEKVRAALSDYGGDHPSESVFALYDATLMGSAKDGALFFADRFVFQNTNLEQPQVVRYGDLVRVTNRRKLLGGRKVHLDVNRGRATVELVIDFSGKPDAAEFVARLLHEAMMRDIVIGSSEREASEPDGGSSERRVETDREAVEAALDGLSESGLLTEADRLRLLRALDRS